MSLLSTLHLCADLLMLGHYLRLGVSASPEAKQEHLRLLEQMRAVNLPLPSQQDETEHNNIYYTAHKARCIHITNRIAQLHTELTLTTTASSSIPPATVHLCHAVCVAARSLILQQIMPSKLVFAQQKWWMAKKIKQHQQIDTQVTQLNTDIQTAIHQIRAVTLKESSTNSHGSANGVASSSWVSSSRSSESIGASTDSDAVDYAELKQFLVGSGQPTDAHIMAMLHVLEPAADEQQTTALTIHLMNTQIDQRVSRLQQELSATQQKHRAVERQLQMDLVIAQLEAQMKATCQWDTAAFQIVVQQLQHQMQQTQPQQQQQQQDQQPADLTSTEMKVPAPAAALSSSAASCSTSSSAAGPEILSEHKNGMSVNGMSADYEFNLTECNDLLQQQVFEQAQSMKQLIGDLLSQHLSALDLSILHALQHTITQQQHDEVPPYALLVETPTPTEASTVHLPSMQTTATRSSSTPSSSHVDTITSSASLDTTASNRSVSSTFSSSSSFSSTLSADEDSHVESSTTSSHVESCSLISGSVSAPSSSSSSSLSSRSSLYANWKYKFRRFDAHEMMVDFEADPIGEGKTGCVYLCHLRLGDDKTTIAAAFKLFEIPQSMRSSLQRALKQMQHSGNNRSTASSSRNGHSSGSSSGGSSSGSSSGTSGADVLSASTISDDPNRILLARVMKEAKMAWSLNGHANCVGLYGVCLDPNACGLLMQYCNSGTLQEHLYTVPDYDAVDSKKRLSFDQRLSCISQIISGLYFLHSKGVVHRDLKSANVLLHNYGTSDHPLYSFKVNDYGSARMTKDYMTSFVTGNASVAKLHDTASTIRWQAPELDTITKRMTKAEKDAIQHSRAVDVYALGCVMGEVFTCKPPYAEADSAAEVHSQRVNPSLYPFSELEFVCLHSTDTSQRCAGPCTHPGASLLVQLMQACLCRQAKDRPSIAMIHDIEWPAIMSAIITGSTDAQPNHILDRSPPSTTLSADKPTTTRRGSGPPPPVPQRPSRAALAEKVPSTHTTTTASQTPGQPLSTTSYVTPLPPLSPLELTQRWDSLLSSFRDASLSAPTVLSLAEQLLSLCSDYVLILRHFCNWRHWDGSRKVFLECITYRLQLDGEVNRHRAIVCMLCRCLQAAIQHDVVLAHPHSFYYLLSSVKPLRRCLNTLLSLFAGDKQTVTLLYQVMYMWPVEDSLIHPTVLQFVLPQLNNGAQALTAIGVDLVYTDDTTVTQLSNCLALLPHLTALCITYRFTYFGDQRGALSESSLIRLCTVLTTHLPRLTRFSLMDALIGDTGCKHLAQALSHLSHLTMLHLQGNRIGDEGCISLSKAFPALYALKQLHVGNNTMTPIGWSVLIQALSMCRELQWFDACYNKMGVEGCIALAQALPQWKQLIGIDVKLNDPLHCDAVYLQLYHLRTLRTLRLVDSPLHDSLLSAFRSGCLYALTSLDLSHNGMTDAQCMRLLDCLSLHHLHQLSILNLSYNEIGDIGMHALQLSLPHCKNLLNLSVSHNFPTTPACWTGFLSGLKHLSTAESFNHLTFGFNNIEDEGCMALCEAFPVLPSLTSLSMANCMIGGKGAQALLAAARSGALRSLSTVVLGETDFPTTITDQLAALIPNCKLELLGRLIIIAFNSI